MKQVFEAELKELCKKIAGDEAKMLALWEYTQRPSLISDGLAKATDPISKVLGRKPELEELQELLKLVRRLAEWKLYQLEQEQTRTADRTLMLRLFVGTQALLFLAVVYFGFIHTPSVSQDLQDKVDRIYISVTTNCVINGEITRCWKIPELQEQVEAVKKTADAALPASVLGSVMADFRASLMAATPAAATTATADDTADDSDDAPPAPAPVRTVKPTKAPQGFE